MSKQTRLVVLGVFVLCAMAIYIGWTIHAQPQRPIANQGASGAAVKAQDLAVALSSARAPTTSASAAITKSNPASEFIPPQSRNKLAAILGKRYAIENLGNEFAGLSDKAKNGDMTAARTLENALRVCAGVPKTWDELDAASANANRENLAPNWKEVMQYDLEYKKSLFSQCSGTTQDQVGTRSNWLSLLAESGDSDARLKYVFAARPTDTIAADYEQQMASYRDNASRYIQSEIDSGNPRGLLTMGQQYFNSGVTIAGVVPLYSPDPVQAYTYFYAYGLASPDAATTTNLAKLQNQLSPAQLQDATNAAIQMYTKCCSQKR